MKSLSHSEPRTLGYPLSKGSDRTIVGVDLARGCIRLAMGRRGRIEAYRHVVVPSDIDQFSPVFEDLLATTLREFCKHHGRVSLWATSSFRGLSIRSLRVPKVPRRQLSLAVRWALRRELSDSLKGMLIDYVVEGEVAEKGTRKIAVTACAVRHDDIERLRQLFAKTGFPLVGLTVPCFTFKNIVLACGLADKTRNSLFLDVDRHSSHLLLCSKGRVVVSREFRPGVDAFLDACMNEVPTGESAESFLAQLSNSHADPSPLTGPARQAVVEGFLPVLNRLMRQFDLTLEATEDFNEMEFEELHLSGPISTCPEVREFISSHAGLPVVPLNPLSVASPSPALCETASIEEASWFAPAVGLALSNGGQTLNLLHPTQSAFEREARSNVNQWILGAFIVASLVAGIAWAGLSVRVSQLQQHAARLGRQAVHGHSELSVDGLVPMVETLVTRYRQRADVVRDRAILAMMAEITLLTDEQIQLMDVEFKMVTLKEKAGDMLSNRTSQAYGSIHLKGRIFGERTKQASHLASYQIKLEESPLFNRASINESISAIHADAAVLQFSITVTPALSGVPKGGGA